MKLNRNLPEFTAYSVTSTALLSRLLADQYMLSLQTLNCYWQVQYTEHAKMNSFLEWQLDRLDGMMSKVIGRLETLERSRIKEASEYLRLARLSDYADDDLKMDTMLQELRHNHDTLIEMLSRDIDAARHEAGDDSTGEFLRDMSAQHVLMSLMIKKFFSNHTGDKEYVVQ